jgi:hypothetical protein
MLNWKAPRWVIKHEGGHLEGRPDVMICHICPTAFMKVGQQESIGVVGVLPYMQEPASQRTDWAREWIPIVFLVNAHALPPILLIF